MRLPASPMYIRAGGRFQIRKPTRAPVSGSANTALAGARRVRPTRPATATTELSPSMLSRRLKALVRPTIQIRVRPTFKGNESVICHTNPSPTAATATESSTASLTMTFAENRSSTSPRTRMIDSRARTRLRPGAATANPTTNPIQIASPPR
jgi:hypothetical protein